jgi:histidinol phosphatase-like PHP family hydrolase
MLAYAEKIGIKTVGFTDHFYQYPYQATPVFSNCGPAIVDQLRLELKENQTNVRVLIGCEADQVRLDMLSIDADYARQLDFVMVAASHFHLSNTQHPDNLEPRTVAEHYLGFLRKALESDFVNIIAHPFYTPGHTLGEPERYMAEMRDAELYEIAEKSTNAW